MALLVCPECKSSKLVKYGWKWHKNKETGIRTKRQQYFCNHCGRVTVNPTQPQPRNDKGKFIPHSTTQTTANTDNTSAN